MQTHELRPALGLPKKLPIQGMEPKKLNGTYYYMVPQKPLRPKQRKRSTHRIWAICPRCACHIPAGRLHQHIDTNRCKQAAVGVTIEDFLYETYNAQHLAKKDYSQYYWCSRHKAWHDGRTYTDCHED